MDAKIARVQSAPAMKLFAYVIACAITIGCQRGGSTAPPVSQQYRSDIENLCEAMVRSGADRLAAGERALTIASWLSGHMVTREAHAYLVEIQPLAGEAKALALETEARRVGLSGCALAAEWRAAPPP
jgi:hypothetical protein